MHADDVALLLGGELRGQWIVGIDAVQREVTLDGHRCIHGLLLVEVEVAAVTGSHDDLVVQTGCLDASRFATPRHHRGMRRQSALQNLVPADDIASAAHHVLLHAVDEPTLQCLLVGQPLALHQRLAVGTLLPCLLGALIAPDVDVVAGEDLHHLVEYPFQEAESLLLGAIDLVEHVEVVAHHVVLAQSARQLRVGGQRSRSMSGHLHLDEAVGRVGHDFAHLLLCVVAALLLVVVAPRVVVIGVS